MLKRLRKIKRVSVPAIEQLFQNKFQCQGPVKLANEFQAA
jgi:hypothetical protein